MAEKPKYYTSDEVARIFRFASTKSFYEWRKRHKVRGLRVGRRLLWTEQDMEAMTKLSKAR